MTTTSIGDHLVGTLLDGRYRVIQRLARGGMATVYRATDSRLGRTVAVKVMHEGLGDDRSYARKFDREARSAAKLSHPNVVSVFDQGEDSGRPYIVMEYVSGCTLRNVISAEAPMEPLRALDLIDDILSALGAAHDGGLVHRDIKPENVLISDRGHLKVADFGLSRAVTSQTVTATQGVLIGTVSYLPPELVQHGTADTRSDIYSTGVLLFELLTGTKPYAGETPIQIAYAHVHNRVPLPSTRLTTSWQTSRIGIPPYVDALVRAATQRDPDKRPADARAMQRMVRKAMTALTVGVMDDPALTREFSSLFAPGEDTGGWAAADDGFHVESNALPAHNAVPGVPGDHEDMDNPRGSATPLAELMSSAEPVRPHVSRPRVRPSPRQRTGAPRRAPARHPNASPEVRRRRFAALVMLLILTVTGTTGWWLIDGRYIDTPVLTGLAETAAQDSAGAQGLSLHLEQAFSETVPRGQIVSTEPAAGNDILRGGTINAVVSKGPERYAMPKVVGVKRDDAVKSLTDNHLAVGTINEDWHEELAPGLVSRASADPGDQLRRDTRVDLTLSKGPEPIQVPDYRGRSARDAQAALERLGFDVTVRTANSATVAAGNVISQSPASGVRNRGDKITLVRSVGPELRAVPDIAGKPVAEATEILTNAGFKVSTQHAEPPAPPPAPAPPAPAEGANPPPAEPPAAAPPAPEPAPPAGETAVRTDPAAGQHIPEGSSIILFVK